MGDRQDAETYDVREFLRITEPPSFVVCWWRMLRRIGPIAVLAGECFLLFSLCIGVVDGSISVVYMATTVIVACTSLLLVLFAVARAAAAHPSVRFPREINVQNGVLQFRSPFVRFDFPLHEGEWREGSTWDSFGDEAWLVLPRGPAIIIRNGATGRTAVCGLTEALREKWRVVLSNSRATQCPPKDEYDVSRFLRRIIRPLFVLGAGWLAAAVAIQWTGRSEWGIKGAVTGIAAALLALLTNRSRRTPNGRPIAHQVSRLAGAYWCYLWVAALIAAAEGMTLSESLRYVAAHAFAGAAAVGLAVVSTRLRRPPVSGSDEPTNDLVRALQ